MDREAATRRSVLPEGVEIREGKRQSRLRVTFYWCGNRCRETLDIPATASNIKYAGRLVGEIKNAIERGVFDYVATFPNSKHARITVKEAKRYKVGDLLGQYLDTARRTESLAPSSIACYARWIDARLLPAWGDTWLDELATLDLRAWIVDMVSELAPKSIRNCVGILSTILNQAHVDGLITVNPLTPIKLRSLLPRKRKTADDDVDPFNDEEITAILAAFQDDATRAMFQFAFASGVRTGELIALKWSKIDKLRNTIRIEDNITSAEIGTVEKTTKTDNVRDIPILPAAAEALAIMRPISFMASDYIFLHPVSNQHWRDSHQLRKAWAFAVKKSGVRYRNPYQTRHTFASRLLMAGEQELLVAYLLGHATVEMVRRHYGRYIRQPEGVILRGDYSKFGSNCPESAPNKTIKTVTG